MNKHTPGPWEIGTPGPNGCYTIGTLRGLMIAMIAHSICEPDQVEEAKGNAALIAAAPELLDIVLDYVRWIEIGRRDHDLYERAIAAIAKAKGEWNE